MKKSLLRYSILFFLSILSQHLFSQKLIKGYPQPNGVVNAMTVKGDTLIIGGAFTRIYDEDSSSKYGALIDTVTNGVHGFWPKTNGPVYAAISDGNKGLFIGGNFSKVGDSMRHSLAHIDSNGVISNRISKAGVLGTVKALAASPDTLYVGGGFLTVGQLFHHPGALLLKSVSEKQKWPVINGIVKSAVPDGKGGWYIAGTFTRAGGIKCYNIARIDSSGNVRKWPVEINGSVEVIKLNNNRIYIGGAFSLVNGQPKQNIAAIDTSGKLISSFAATANAHVLDFAFHNNLIYVAGRFTSLSSTSVSYLSSVDTNGTYANWAPRPNGIVRKLQVFGNYLYVAGDFSDFNVTSRPRLASFLLTSEDPTTWRPAANGPVYSLLVTDSLVYAGGAFTSIGGQSRNRLAAVSITTGLASSWNPNSDGYVHHITKVDSNIYVAGAFTTMANQDMRRFAKIDSSSGIAQNWGFHFDDTAFFVHRSDGRFLIGGRFNYYGGVLKRNLAAFHAKSDTLLSMALSAADTVLALIHNKNTLYVAGKFWSLAGNSRYGLGAINTDNSVVNNWNPSGGNDVNCMLLKGARLYVGGTFTLMGGATRNRIAAVDTGTGLATSWNPNSNGVVFTLGQARNYIYAGGQFTNIGTQNRINLAALDTGTGTAASFLTISTGPVRTLLIVNNTIYVGGLFSSATPGARSYFTAHNIFTGVTTGTYPQPNAGVFCIAASGKWLYAGGEFSLIGGMGRNRLALISLTNKNVLAFNPSFDGPVNAVKVSGDKLYAGGGFLYVNNISRNRLCSFNMSSGTLSAWNPSPNSNIQNIKAFSGKVVIEGGFNYVNLYPRSLIALLDSAAPYPAPWAPNPNAGIVSMEISNNKLFVGGTFTTMDGSARKRLASFELPNMTLTNWNPGLTWAPEVIVAIDTQLALAGPFDSIGGVYRNRVGIIGQNSNTVDNWRPMSNSNVFSGYARGQYLFLGGDFDTINNETHRGLALYKRNNDKPLDWDIDAVKDPYYMRILAIEGKDDKIIVGGHFSSVMDQPLNYLAVFEAPEQFIAGPVNQNLCLGDSIRIKVPFLKVPAPSSSNTYTVQLSDSSGSFANSLNIGSLNSNLVSGEINAVIPPTVKTSSFYRIRIINGNDTSDASNLINIKTHPKAAFFISSDSACFSTNVFAFTDTSKGEGSLNRLWRIEGSSTKTDSIAFHSFSSIGIHTVKLISTNKFGCPDSISKQVKVLPSAVPQIFVNKEMQCKENNRFDFVDTSSITTGSYTRMWYFSETDSSNLAKPSRTYPNEADYKVRLILKTDKGCIDSSYLIIKVLPKPNAGIQFTKPLEQCFKGNSFAFTDSSTSGYARKWHLGENDSSTVKTLSKTFKTEGNFIVRLLLNNNGCVDTASVNVTVHPSPKANFLINNSVQCARTNYFVFNDTSTGANTWKWKISSGDSSTGKQYPVKISKSGNFTVKLYALNSFGCIDSFSKPITIHPNINAGFRISDSSRCAKSNYFTFVDSSSFAGSYTRSFYFGDGNTSSLNQVSNSYPAAGEYTPMLVTTTSQGCRDTFSRKLTVLANPVVGTISGPSLSLQFKQETYRTAPKSGSIFNWFVQGVLQSTHYDSIQYLWMNAGIQKVQLVEINSFACYSDTASKLVEVIAVNSIGKLTESQITIYPQPASRDLHITHQSGGIIALKIYDSKGSLMAWHPEIKTQQYLDISHLPAGIYYCEFSRGNEILGRRKLSVTGN